MSTVIRVILYFSILVVLLHAACYTGFVLKDYSAIKADLIVVFPGLSHERNSKGHWLALNGFADRLTFTSYKKSQVHNVIKKHGSLPKVEIIISGKSRTTFEDVLFTRKIIKEHKIKSIILVSSSYHLTRSYFLLKVFLIGSGVDVNCYGVGLSEDESNIRLIHIKMYVNEFIKFWFSLLEMLEYQLIGDLVLDIPTLVEVRLILKKYFLFKV